MMGRRRDAKFESIAADYSRKMCFDEECRRIRMSRIKCKPFSDALEALNSDKNSQTRRGKFHSAAEKSSSRVRKHFSIGEMTKKLIHCGSISGDDCIHRGVDAINPSTNNDWMKKKQRTFKLEIAEWESDMRRKKIDVSEKDAILAANRGVCNRLLISSVDHHFWARRDTQWCSAFEPVSPLRMNTEMSFTGTESSFTLSTDEEPQDETKIVETNDVLHSEAPNDEHSTFDSVSDNDFPSTPPSINVFNNKYQEEHESPVSVLDQYLAEDHFHKSSIIIFQNGKKSLKPRRLCFDDEQDYNVSRYVHLVFKACSLNWGQISTIRPLSEELLHSSLYYEVEHLFSGPHFDTRLLFDRVNDILLQIQRSPATEKQRINHRLALEEAVVDEIQREAEFYQTQERTLDQIVAKDVADCRLWFDLLYESEHDIIIHISQHILEESIVDVMLDIHC